MSNRGKNWCFTINNYDESELTGLQEKLKEESSYFIIGKETGEKNGTPHLQGYVQLNKREWSKKVKSVIAERAHIEQARGNG